MTTAVTGLGLLTSLMQFKFVGMPYMRGSLPLPLSMADLTEEQNRVFFCVLTHIPMKDRRFFFPVEVIFFKNVVLAG